MAMRFMGGLNHIVGALHRPGPLKVIVETLGFQHLDLDVTVPRVFVFRDAIIDLLEMELESSFTSKARSGWRSMLHWVGGAYIYVRREFAGSLKIIASSWRTANKKAKDLEDVDEEEGLDEVAGVVEGAVEQDVQADGQGKGQTGSKQSSASGEAKQVNAMRVPTTFNEMFLFNGAVMGFGNSLWMPMVLEAFDAIVTNAANSFRLQEECDTLSLSIAKYKGTVNLSEFKAVMLASLRSLVPKDWNSAHEVAWTWLWGNVERILQNLLGKPAVQEKALERFISSLTEDSQNYFRRELFRRFFALAPAGQDYFKQSTTRLYFIADKVVEFGLQMFRAPKIMVEEISALGLRKVGYGIPTELFGPFVSGAVELVRTMTEDANAEDGFRWSLSLVSRILVRTINEGSTIVMQAINTNSAKQLEKAVSCAPRGKRSMWLLDISVGSQSISPLYWSIESGSLESAKAMIQDLLIIRADRDNYYYGADDLFARHPDIIQRLCADAEILLPGLLDGLIWRSRLTQGGRRRVNFYIKHLVQDADGNFSKCLDWLVEEGDPKIACHPAVVLFSDLVWGGLANRFFLLGKCWFLFTLCLFIISQSILQHLNEGDQHQMTRTSIMAIRCFIYVGSLGREVQRQLSEAVGDFRARRYIRLSGGICFPKYLGRWNNAVSFLLMICVMLMLTQEPIIWCADNYDPDADSGRSTNFANGRNYDADLFTQHCPSSSLEIYAPVSMVAMLLYWTLIVDLTVFSTRVSAFVLVCAHTMSELGLFILAMFFLILAFSSAVSSLDHHNDDFSGIPSSMMSLTEMTLSMYPTGHFAVIAETPIVLAVVSLFSIMGNVFLLNLLVAQLTGAYQTIHTDLVGYARLNRGKIINQTMAGVSNRRWSRWLATLKFDERLEYNEGDVGVAGGLQLLEPANANPTNVDMIRRFGGSTSPAMQWPEDKDFDDESDKFERLEKVVLRAAKKMAGGSRRDGLSGGSSSMGQSSSSGSGSDAVVSEEAAGSQLS
ncbi:unnamed protein product [Polarella glacialis]|nr:unnamed protein product [Polarella glacialis]